MGITKNDTFAMMKTLLDAHTMGIHAASAVLRDCGYRVIIVFYSVKFAYKFEPMR